MNGIIVIGESSLPAKFQSENFWRRSEAEQAILVTEFKQYCADNSIYYYARPREDFHSWEAYELAKAAGAKRLLMEDLS